jgi:hypothetical protein
MIKTIWRSEVANLYKGIDAQMVADEIADIGEAVTAEQIVDKAKDENTELHKCFTWDDEAAAEKYRIIEARQIVRHLVREELPDAKNDTPPLRVFYKTNNGEGYKHIERTIIKKEDEYQALLARAMMELRAFKAKYSMLEELREILDLIS